MELRFKECPENIIEMILSKLDENNHEESKIKELWKENEIQINSPPSLINKLNDIISILNKKKLKYYKLDDFEYNLIL
jgi:hypothetical protein